MVVPTPGCWLARVQGVALGGEFKRGNKGSRQNGMTRVASAATKATTIKAAAAANENGWQQLVSRPRCWERETKRREQNLLAGKTFYRRAATRAWKGEVGKVALVCVPHQRWRMGWGGASESSGRWRHAKGARSDAQACAC